jgi:hypothetical protein
MKYILPRLVRRHREIPMSILSRLTSLSGKTYCFAQELSTNGEPFVSGSSLLTKSRRWSCRWNVHRVVPVDHEHLFTALMIG